MRRSLPPALGLLVALSVATTAAAQDAADRADLPDGWRPEGVATDGTRLYVGSLADGAVWSVDPASGEARVLVPGVDGTIAVGLDVDAAHGRLWVAGGPTGEVRSDDIESGQLLATYPFESGFPATGALFRLDAVTGETVAIDSGDADLSGGDGLELDGDILYVVRNSADTITALRLDEASMTATPMSELAHPGLDVRTTAAQVGEDVWVVNARFTTDAEPGTEYWLTRLEAVAEGA